MPGKFGRRASSGGDAETLEFASSTASSPSVVPGKREGGNSGVINGEDGGEGSGSSSSSSSSSSHPPHELKGVRLIATLVKSFIGSGVLFLPKAFANGGWLFSVLIMAFMAALSNICILKLVECRGYVKGSYGRIGYHALGKGGQVAVDISLVLSQAGFGCVYVVFIARNVLQLLNSSSCWLPGSWLWLLILLEWPLFTPLTWVRRIAKFGPTNIAADVLIAGGLLGILSYCIHGIITVSSETGVTPSLPAFNSDSFALMLGTAVYAFEGVGMVVPIYDSLSPSQQKAFPTTMSLTLAGVAGVYIIVGIVPYIYFAGMTNIKMEDAVTLNLPKEWWSILIIAGYCVALLFSYPLMLFPAVKILEKAVSPLFGGGSWSWGSGASAGSAEAGLLKGEGLSTEDGHIRHDSEDALDAADDDAADDADAAGHGDGRAGLPRGHFKWRRNAYRGFIVAVTLLVAYIGSEQLDNFVSLIGCFCCTPLAFIYPAIFHLRLVKNTTMFAKAVDVAIILFGSGVLVFSTYEAIAGWSVQTIDPCPKT